jgi:hypothetical protein
MLKPHRQRSIIFTFLLSLVSLASCGASQQLYKCNYEAVKLGDQIIFCLNGEDAKERAKELDGRLKTFLDKRHSYDLDSINFNKDSKKLIVIKNLHTQKEALIIDIQGNESTVFGSKIDPGNANVLNEVRKSIKQAIETESFNLNSEELRISWGNAWGIIFAISSFALLLALSNAIRSRSNLSLNEKFTLGEVIKKIKADLGKTDQDNTEVDQRAMFALGPVSLNLKTVLTKQGSSNFEINVLSKDAGGFGMKNSISTGNENTQEISIVLNPIKVFSGEIGEITVQRCTEPDCQKLEGFSYNFRTWKNVTVADWVIVGEKNYLVIIHRNDKEPTKLLEETWIDAKCIVSVASKETSNTGRGKLVVLKILE